MLQRKTQFIINHGPEHIKEVAKSQTACLMYYLDCIQKLHNQKLEIPVELTNFHDFECMNLADKQDILAFSFLYSPENFLNKKMFLIDNEENVDQDKVNSKNNGHFFAEKLQVEVDDDGNCKKVEDVCLFFTFDWIEKFYAKPMQELSKEIQRKNKGINGLIKMTTEKLIF